MDLIDRQTVLDQITASINQFGGRYTADQLNMWGLFTQMIKDLPSAEPVRCKDCKHNPKYEWFGCPMSHLSEAQRPETAWCWKGERKTDAETEV